MKHEQTSLFNEGTREYPDLEYVKGFLNGFEANRLLELLRTGIAWKQHYVTLFGKRHACPRLSAWYGDPEAAYTYSDNQLDPIPWTTSLAELRAQVERRCSAPFNSVLANLYRTGSDSMGWHSDDEPELGREPLIASVSLGASRKLRFRRKDAHKTTVEVWLEHGSLLIMRGTAQREWHHALPKTRRPVDERINLTYRLISTIKHV